MKTSAYLRDCMAVRQCSSAEPGGTLAAGGYGEHTAARSTQHPAMQHSISCPWALAQLCWLAWQVAEPSLILPLLDRPEWSLPSAALSLKGVKLHSPTSTVTRRNMASIRTAPSQGFPWAGCYEAGCISETHYLLLIPHTRASLIWV